MTVLDRAVICLYATEHIWRNRELGPMARMACCQNTASKRYGERHDDQSRRDRERDPQSGGNRLGTRRCDVGRRRRQREHSAHDGCTGDEPENYRLDFQSI